jgi:cytochrome c-type biogenesis protein
LLLFTISAASRSPIQGFLLAVTFGLGRGFPFLLAGVIASAITGFTRLGAWSRIIQVVSGFALLLVSIYYANTFVALS